MEFNHEALNVGDVFYTVKERNEFFHRKKIHQEIDGQDWFRYDIPLRTYKLVTHEVIGVIRKHLEGDWSLGEQIELETSFLIKSLDVDGTHLRTSEFYFEDYNKYFLDRESALENIKTLEKRARELDKTLEKRAGELDKR